MRIFLGAKRFGLFLVSFAFLAGLIGATPVNAVSGPNSTPSYESLFSSGVVSSPESLGRIERDAVKAAKAHLVSHAKEWDIDPTQFQASEAIDGVAGMSTVRFTQSIYGVEVANSLLAVTVDKNGSLLSFNKSLSDYSGQSESVISQDAATEIIKSKLSSDIEVGSSQVIVSEPELVILDSALVDNIPSGKHLAWRANTSVANNATSISLTYLSQDGQQVLSTLPYVREIDSAAFVCDLQKADQSTAGVLIDTQTSDKFLDITAGGAGLPLCGVNTVGRVTNENHRAIVNISRARTFFDSVLGLDLAEEKYLGNISEIANNDSISRISAFINVCVVDGKRQSCPYGNAFWVPWESPECNSGACSGIFLGRGFDKADDVIAHELAHGVTFSLAFSSAMADDSETAALSEGISDIFGEAMDQLSVTTGESGDPLWKMGEDVLKTGFRNLQKPDVLRIDEDWTPGDSHDNSGPLNRLAYLLANGGTVGKTKISPLGSTANSVTKNNLCDSQKPKECLGIVRMSQLVFATTSNLTATANYFEFGREMNNACFALVKAKASGFTANSCKSVQSALVAQGFTNASINLKKIPVTTKRTSTVKFTASMQAVTGTKISGQKLALQTLVGGKWVTKQSRVTDASGKASFSVKLNSKREYSFRVVTFSYSGLYSVKSNSTSTVVN